MTVDKDYCIEKINKEYAFLVFGGKDFILWTKNGTHQICQTDAIKNLWANKRIKYLGEDGTPHDLCRFKAWMEHGKRRTFTDYVFDPVKTPLGAFNIWTGFSVQEREGDVSIYLDHLRDVLCSGNDDHFNYVCMWIADLFQNFDYRNKPGVALVFKGERGTGRSLAVAPLIELFGKHGKSIVKSDQIFGRFNKALHDAVLVVSEEAFFAGAKDKESSIKDAITGSFNQIEIKNVDTFTAPNYCKFIMLSNCDWVVPCGQHERRFMVLNVSNKRRGNHDYFDKLADFCKDHLPEILFFFRHYQYDLKELRKVPQTQALTEQKIASFDVYYQYIYKILVDGVLPGCQQRGDSCALTNMVVNDFCDSAPRNSYDSKHGRAQVLRNRLVLIGVEHARLTAKEDAQRQYVFQFPDLQECRENFDKHMSAKFDWGDKAAEWSFSVPRGMRP